ncbi:MAG TPA: ATP-binding protein [Gammaproteobacteria bacterium]|nr:ATP-binding protein [Gammaproteobacteria bacterium]
MRLAGQLLAVSTVTLLLPWAGCQYTREVETALRDGEQQAIASTARLLAAALAPAAATFAAEAERWAAGHGGGADVYVHELAGTPTLDGFVEDWGASADFAEPIGGLVLLAGRRGELIHLFIGTPGSAPPGALEIRGRNASLEFFLEAPGPVTAVVSGAAGDPRTRGYWQATSRGWQIEARIPAALLDGRLGARLLEPDGVIRAASFGEAPGWMSGPVPAAQAALDAVAPPGQRIYVTDRAGFVLAIRGPGRRAAPGAGAGWPERLYRHALGARLAADPPPAARPGQLSGRHVELASIGESDVRRFALPSGGLLAAAAPIGSSRAPAALVVVERDTAEILSLTRAPTRRLLVASLVASMVATVVLLGFAMLLSVRIRRLSKAATAAVGKRGEIAGPLPGARAGDELGDLARGFGRLLGNVRDHNLYLQGLGGRLAHELRTPLAVVRSSLDNLEAENAPAGPWLGRARGGVDRMSVLVNALSAAQKIERAVAAAEHERFDVAAQVSEMVEAYRVLYPERVFQLQRPAQPCLVEGAPDLIAQMLDKLVENAADFAPPTIPLRIAIVDAGPRWHLVVANAGSRLPAGGPARLFDSLVSVRETGAEPHLGLGLFIVRLVAEHHGCRATARNLPDGGGVEFVIELPRAGDSPATSRYDAVRDIGA